MNCFGIDVETGGPIELSFDGTGISVRRADGVPDDSQIAPCFIDLQVNGFAGVDYNNPATSHDDIARSIAALFATGVTRFYPTVITGPPADMQAALRNLSRAKDSLGDGGAIDGFHVEGPHICPEEGPRGAHPRRWVRPPDLDEFRRWQDATEGRVRIVTLSPEWPDAPRYIDTSTP